MNRRQLIAAAASFCLVAPSSRAQGKRWLIGMLLQAPLRDQRFVDVLANADLKAETNVTFMPRSSRGAAAQVEANAAELVAAKPDVLLAIGSHATLVLAKRTSSVPIVASVGDPVGLGLAKSLSRPGGNVSGTSIDLRQLSARQIEILRIILPSVQEVVLFTDRSNPVATGHVSELFDRAARAAGVQLRAVGVERAGDLEQAFASIRGGRVAAIPYELSIIVDPKSLARLALSTRVPTISMDRDVAAGMLAGYTPEWGSAGVLVRLARILVAVIGKARIGDIPFEVPEGFKLAINSSTATALGIPLRPELLARADKVLQ